MDDPGILERIGDLVEQERILERSGVDPTDERTARRREIEIALDQCWDLLRQRRARRSVGADPDDAVVRSADVVEHYQQ